MKSDKCAREGTKNRGVLRNGFSSFFLLQIVDSMVIYPPDNTYHPLSIKSII
ncbi:hypothetical protein MNV_610003 [Candidatus Methanoperedens nitroreducens]|uniref:Uncharacterized protein n=1 Tax=Candidatus Methanoperedens nitratireducens TaxID=1392998 RepID=A0A284VSF0_9EURY|nr:hypothetical protein MNV_610003 [Candidatus Methanoperedens nitroreducens]